MQSDSLAQGVARVCILEEQGANILCVTSALPTTASIMYAPGLSLRSYISVQPLMCLEVNIKTFLALSFFLIQ